MALILEDNVTRCGEFERKSRSLCLVTFTFGRRNCPRLAVSRWSLQRGLTRRRALDHINGWSSQEEKLRDRVASWVSRIHSTVSGIVDRVIRETSILNSGECSPAVPIKRAVTFRLEALDICLSARASSALKTCQKLSATLLEKSIRWGKERGGNQIRPPLHEVAQRDIALAWSILLRPPPPSGEITSRGIYSPRINPSVELRPPENPLALTWALADPTWPRSASWWYLRAGDEATWRTTMGGIAGIIVSQFATPHRAGRTRSSRNWVSLSAPARFR